MSESEQATGFGPPLSAARKARGLSPEEVHQHTRLELRIIEALELERIDELGQPVYARGYIRSYARLLELDPQPLIEAYNAASGSSEGESWSPPPLEHREAGHGIRPQWVALGLGLLILAMVLFWVFGRPADERTMPELAASATGQAAEAGGEAREAAAGARLPAMPEPDAVPSTEAAHGEAALAAVGNEATDREEGATAATTPATSPEAETPSPARDATAPEDSAPAEAPAASPAAGLEAIELDLNGDSWVEIIDGRGQKLVRRLLRPGQHYRFEGVPPFSVFLGNADAVRLRYGDREIDPTRWRRPNATARFRIPE